WRYEPGDNKEYCNSLLLKKPNDVHSVLSRKISEMLQRDFAREPAKSLKYGLTFGAQVAKAAQIIGADMRTAALVVDGFWKAAYPLADLKDQLQRYWESVGKKKFILGIDGRKIPT